MNTTAQLFEPCKVEGGTAKAFWTVTKIALLLAFIGAVLDVNTRRYPEPFMVTFREALFFVVSSAWLIWLAAWAFGGNVIWPMRAAEKFLKSMQPKWEDDFKAHTGVTDRISVVGYLENGLAQVDGIAYKDQMIHFMTRGQVLTFPYSSVRDWQWRVETADTVSVHGTGLQAAAIQASVNESNLNAAGKAFAHSGLFLKIADERHPVLHFHCDDQAVLQRWQEIFTQIEEGKI
jgi:hypothetical protein